VVRPIMVEVDAFFRMQLSLTKQAQSETGVCGEHKVATLNGRGFSTTVSIHEQSSSTNSLGQRAITLSRVGHSLAGVLPGLAQFVRTANMPHSFQGLLTAIRPESGRRISHLAQAGVLIHVRVRTNWKCLHRQSCPAPQICA
jgi:hypothetical protein